MAPLKFGDYTKAIDDIIGNDFCFDRKLKVKAVTANGFTLTSESTLKAPSNAVAAKLTAGFSLGHGITINKLAVGHDGRFTVDAGLVPAAVPGLSMTTLVEDGGKGATVGEIGLTYKHKLFTASTKIDAMNGPTVKESVSVQQGPFLLGGEIKYSTGLDKKAEAALKDYNLGCGYVEGDLAVSVNTLNKVSDFKVAVHHAMNKETEVGATYEHGPKLLTFGAMYKLDALTTLQGKVTSNGILTVNAHQKLSPTIKLIASSEVDTKSLSADSHKFGLQFLVN